MSTNKQLIQTFYDAFSVRDYSTMQNCYSDKAEFTDEAFVNLNAGEVRAMWEMLITGGKDLKVEYKNVEADEHKGSAEWVATYTFSLTGRKVVNRIKADFIFENGKIIKHRDYFNFYLWAKQAFGVPGYLLGWTGFFRNKIQQKAKNNLKEFMKANAPAMVN